MRTRTSVFWMCLKFGSETHPAQQRAAAGSNKRLCTQTRTRTACARPRRRRCAERHLLRLHEVHEDAELLAVG
eukprot:3959709-Prymnesium_polylepis.2